MRIASGFITDGPLAQDLLEYGKNHIIAMQHRNSAQKRCITLQTILLCWCGAEDIALAEHEQQHFCKYSTNDDKTYMYVIKLAL